MRDCVCVCLIVCLLDINVFLELFRSFSPARASGRRRLMRSDLVFLGVLAVSMRMQAGQTNLRAGSSGGGGAGGGVGFQHLSWF